MDAALNELRLKIAAQQRSAPLLAVADPASLTESGGDCTSQGSARLGSDSVRRQDGLSRPT